MHRRSLKMTSCILFHRFSIFLVLVTIPLTPAQFPDFHFACPARGCSSRGTFSWPTPAPSESPAIVWNWTEPGVTYGNPDYQGLGCSSSMTTVVCPTFSGWVSLTAQTGDVRWASTWTPTPAKPGKAPYLPLVDFYGNVIHTDKNQLAFVSSDGTPVNSVNITNVSPSYGATLSDSRVVLLTSPKTDKPQVSTYGVYGDNYANTQLKGHVDNFSGTFVASGHPVIHKERAYIATKFVLDNMTNSTRARNASGSHRLYAIDLSGNKTTSNAIAWFINLPDEVRTSTNGNSGHFEARAEDSAETYLAFYDGVIYVNYVRKSPILFAANDTGHCTTILFQVPSHPGSMAIYDRENNWTNITATGPRPLWISYNTDSGPRFTGYDRQTGKILSDWSHLSVLTKFGDITSTVSVTRQADHPDRDLLVFGTQDDDGQAYVVALEMRLWSAFSPDLLWAVNVSGPRVVPGRPSVWTVGGQLASVAVIEDNKLIGYGLVVTVVESRGWLQASEVYVRMLM